MLHFRLDVLRHMPLAIVHAQTGRALPCVEEASSQSHSRHWKGVLHAGPMDTCNSAYTAYHTSNQSPDYDTLVSDCQTASTAMSPVQTFLNSASGASSTASGISALSTALAGLPTQAVRARITLLASRLSFGGPKCTQQGCPTLDVHRGRACCKSGHCCRLHTTLPILVSVNAAMRIHQRVALSNQNTSMLSRWGSSRARIHHVSSPHALDIFSSGCCIAVL